MTRRAGQADFAFAPRRQLLHRSRLANLGQHIGQRHADAAFAVFAERHRHNRAYGFGEAITLAQFYSAAARGHERFETLLDRPGQSVRAAIGSPKAGQIRLFQRRIAGSALRKALERPP